jgi:ribosomal protein S18 acetylase RimI-like enzyme
VIEELARPPADQDVRQLAEILVDAVRAGASVSFMAGFTLDAARQWWQQTLEGADGRAMFLVARDAAGIAGTVQLHPAWAPNQPHRAEIAKLLVHRRARRRGVGRALMTEIERRAQHSGFSLLTLDTASSAAEHLYRALGWMPVGVIPDYALNPDGTFCDTAILYKRLAPFNHAPHR